MGGLDEGPAAAGLLREYFARRDVRGLAGSVRDLFRHDRRAGVWLRRRRRQLGPNRAGFAGGAVGRSAGSVTQVSRFMFYVLCFVVGVGMIRVVLPYHLR